MLAIHEAHVAVASSPAQSLSDRRMSAKCFGLMTTIIKVSWC